jgi:hypothetical protein
MKTLFFNLRKINSKCLNSIPTIYFAELYLKIKMDFKITKTIKNHECSVFRNFNSTSVEI